MKNREVDAPEAPANSQSQHRKTKRGKWPWQWRPVPIDLSNNMTLSPTARLLWIILQSFPHWEERPAYPLIDTLRRRMGTTSKKSGENRPMGEKKIQSALKELESAGFLKRERRRTHNQEGRSVRGPNNYYVLVKLEQGRFEHSQSASSQVEPSRNGSTRDNECNVNGNGKGSGGAGGHPPPILTKGQKKKKKNRGAAPDPGAHPQSLSRTSGDAASPDGDDSSSIAPVGANRGSAPDPASQEKIPSLGKIFPEALLTPDGEKRGLTLEDHPDVIAGWFLYYWRRYQGKILGRKPVLTQKDHDAFVHWYQEAEPEHLNSYLALAVAGWKCKGKKQANGYIKWQTAAKCSPQLSSFLRNLTKIEGELDWDHFDEERRRFMLQSVVMSE